MPACRVFILSVIHRLQQREFALIEVRVPEHREKHNHRSCKSLDGPVICLEIYLDQTVKKGSKPEYPFERGSQHQRADDGQISNLRDQVRVRSELCQCQHTSLAGQAASPGLVSPLSAIFVAGHPRVLDAKRLQREISILSSPVVYGRGGGPEREII